MNNWFHLTMDLKPNTWHKHKTFPIFLKYYMETLHNNTVDLICINESVIRTRASLEQLLEIDSTLFEEVKNPETLQILYEK